MIFVDSNIPMYLVGAEHPNKPETLRLLTAVIEAGEPLVTDAEVLQEILHRYHTSQRRDAIKAAFDAILGVVDEVFSIDLEDVQRARQLLLDQEQISSRDALHAAVMERHGVHRIMSFDSGFDEIAGLQRLPGPTSV